MIVVWHVDYLKVSHKDPQEVKRFFKKLESLYGKMRIQRGKKLEYLGMDLDFSDEGKFKLSMVPYIEDGTKMFLDDLEGNIKTPAAEHLFEVNEDAEKLDEERKQHFHTMVARNLFLSKRARPDILPTVAFLCTRVTDPDTDDWKKLARLMLYLKNTAEQMLTLTADECNIAKW